MTIYVSRYKNHITFGLEDMKKHVIYSRDVPEKVYNDLRSAYDTNSPLKYTKKIMKYIEEYDAENDVDRFIDGSEPTNFNIGEYYGLTAATISSYRGSPNLAVRRKYKALVEGFKNGNN